MRSPCGGGWGLGSSTRVGHVHKNKRHKVSQTTHPVACTSSVFNLVLICTDLKDLRERETLLQEGFTIIATVCAVEISSDFRDNLPNDFSASGNRPFRTKNQGLSGAKVTRTKSGTGQIHWMAKGIFAKLRIREGNKIVDDMSSHLVRPLIGSVCDTFEDSR